MRIPIAKILLLLMMSMAVLFMGCSRDSSVTNPNPDAFQPKGTIQGVLVDKASKNPIEGAVVSVGLKSATTNDAGEFVLRDVPATYDALNFNVVNKYTVTVDMRDASEVCGPNAIASCGQFPYPDFAYRGVAVEYTSLNDTDTGDGFGSNDDVFAFSNHSNHDTPVDGLVATLGIEVGKLSAGINGTLTYCLSVHNRGYNTVTEDCTVSVISTNYDDLCDVGECEQGPNSFTGDKRNIVATADTVAGAFSFSGLEAITEYALKASCDGGTLVGEFEDGGHHYWHHDAVKTLSEGTTDGSFCVAYADTTAPILKHVTPQNGAAIGNVTSVDVVFTFSEPIAQTALTDPANVSVCGVTRLTKVDFEGQVWEGVAGDVAYTVEWQNSATDAACNGATDCDQLLVHVPNLAPASIYSIEIDDVLDPWGGDELIESCMPFTDLAGNPFTDAPDNESCDDGGVNGDPYCKSEVSIYTITDCDPLAPTSLAALFQPYDFDDHVVLDWTAAVCAKSYNIYQACDQVYNDGTRIDGQQVLVDNDVDTDDWEFPGSFIDANDCSDIQLECTYCVKSVGPDLSVSANEICVTVADTEEPDLLQPPAEGSGIVGDCSNFNFINGNCDAEELRYCFSEPLDEVSSEMASGYVINPGAFSANAVTVVSALSECDDNDFFCVNLTLSGSMNADDIIETEIRSGASDNICDSNDSGDDDQYVPTNSGGVCVSWGPNMTLDTAAAAGDVTFTDDKGVQSIFAGSDGDCDTTAAGDDVQVVAMGSNTPNDIVCIDAGDNFLLQSTVDPDDEQVDYLFITISAEDVAGNGMDPDFDELDTNNMVH